MKKSIIVVLTAIVVLMFSGIAICSALIPSDESLPSNTSLMTPEGEPYPFDVIIAEPYPTSSPEPELQHMIPELEPYPFKEPEAYPTYPPEPYPTWTPYPTPYPTWTPYPTPYPTWTPTPTLAPTSAPLEGQPSTPPQASTGKTSSGEDISGLPAHSGMTSITEEKVAKIGGAPRKITMISGSQLWVLYNGVWTTNPAAIYYNDWTPMLLYNDQGQWISTEETYPSSWVDKRYWGYLNAGYHGYWFNGDAVGWHKIVAKGSVTGSSNPVWIYVWPTTPTPTPTPTTFTVSAAWPSSYTYYIDSPTCIYFTVNKPCYARVTYIKPGGNIALSGPSYVSAGPHNALGKIGYPKGKRTVVVDAWTSSGEYDSKVTWYNVV